MLTYTNTRVKERVRPLSEQAVNALFMHYAPELRRIAARPGAGVQKTYRAKDLSHISTRRSPLRAWKSFFCLNDTTSLKPSLVSCYLVRESNVGQVARGGFYEYYA